MSMNAFDTKKVVIIEDDDAYREMLEIRLNINGFETMAAGDALEGLQLVRKEEPDLVVLDLRMPGMCKNNNFQADGIDMHMGQKICRMIKFDEKLRHIPILMLTCSDSLEDINQSILSGADGYLMKTASTEFLIREIDKMIGVKRWGLEEAVAV